jgi:hypothetical protein
VPSKAKRDTLTAFATAPSPIASSSRATNAASQRATRQKVMVDGVCEPGDRLDNLVVQRKIAPNLKRFIVGQLPLQEYPPCRPLLISGKLGSAKIVSAVSIGDKS